MPLWGTTGEFEGIGNAKNHCAATAAFNAVYYYRARNKNNSLFVNGSRADTFKALHSKIGNGPVLFPTLQKGLKAYVSEAGSAFSTVADKAYETLKSQIDGGCMCILLLSAGLTEWHYVNAIGYREYESGEKFVRVIDNWYNNSNVYIKSENIVKCYKAHIS